MNIIWHGPAECDEPYFEVEDDTSGLNGCFSYRPKSNGLWDDISLDKFECILFDNPHFNKGSNIFEVKIDEIDERIGYMIPINSLLSDDGQFNNNVKNYAYASFWYLLTQIKTLIYDKNELTDYFHDNTVVCILHKDTLNGKFPDFDINNYIIAFFQRGYIIHSNQPVGEIKYYDYEQLIKSKKTLHIKQANSNLNDSFINDLFQTHLPKEDNALVRFVLAYQAIEHLMGVRCDETIKDSIKKYEAKQIFQNDFIDIVGKSRNERSLITDIFPQTANSKYVDTFKTECKKLFESIGRTSPEKPSDMFYDFRNTLVHNYRGLIKYKQQTAKTIQQFELLVSDICSKYQKT